MTDLPRNISYTDVECAHVTHILKACHLPNWSVPTVSTTLEDLTEEMRKLDKARRLLIAYARSTYQPRYTLNELAEATGLSVSGVRTAYTDQDFNELGEILYPPDKPEDEPPW